MASYSIKLLGNPVPSEPYYNGENVRGLNYSGVVVGSSYVYFPRAAKWNPGPTLLPFLGEHSLANGINDKNVIVGNYGPPAPDNTMHQAFLYSDGIMHDLTNVFNHTESSAQDINNDGLVIASTGSFADVGGLENSRAYLYDSVAQTTPTKLGLLNGHNWAWPTAINNNGQVLGISRLWPTPAGQQVQSPHAFLYHKKKLTDLGSVVAGDGANDINDHGLVVGRHVSNGVYAIAYVLNTSKGSGKFHDLSDFPSCAMSINNKGDIVGYSQMNSNSGQYPHACVWPGGGAMQDLNSLIPPNSGWELREACAINDKGKIAGMGQFDGGNHGYLLTPVRANYNLDLYEATIDPMALILREDIYVKLTLPDPGPDDIKVQVHRLVKQMNRSERENALKQARTFGTYIKELEQELNKY